MYFGKCWLTDPNQQAIKHWEFGLCYKMAGVQSMLPLLVTGKPWASQLNSLCLAFLICSPAQFSRSLVSDSLQPHGLQHTRPPCPSPTPWVYSNSCPLSQWCHPTISSSVVCFSSHVQSFPASGSFPMSQFFTSVGQNTEVSASASSFQKNIQDWFPLGLTGLISLQSKSLLQHHSS